MSTRCLLCLILLFMLLTSAAATGDGRKSADVTLDTVLVIGEQPGPGLWKATRNGHVLWILGTLRPLPDKLIWRSGEVEETTAASQEVIAPANEVVGVNGNLLQGVAIWHARKLHGNERLKDVVSPEPYDRWSALKTRYAGRRTSIEKLRPRFAAMDLFDDAMDESGLTLDDDVWDSVRRIARKNHVHVVKRNVNVVIHDSDKMIEALENAPIDIDMPCFDATLERLETDVQGMRARANAWAVGDIGALRRLPYVDQKPICDAVLSSLQGVEDGPAERAFRIRASWITETETAIAKNQSTFAVVPISRLLDVDGIVADLRNRGFEVDEPQ